MTFLGYTSSDKQIILAMDTMATKIDGTPFLFMEKVIFFKKVNMLMAIKGSLNILSELATKLVEQESYFADSDSLINYVKLEAPKILDSVVSKMPSVKGTITRAYFFYYKNNKPFVLKAEYINTNNFVFIEQEINFDEIKSTNDTSFETEIIQKNIEELADQMYDQRLNYGLDSLESALIIMANFAKLNDPPQVYVGGHLILYKIMPDDFTREIIYDLDPHIQDKDLVTLKQATILANGL